MATFASTQGRPPCAHKTVSRCVLTIPGCCACSDHRPHTHSYFVYVDGVGSVPQGTRWSYYCDHCKSFWEGQIRRAGITASLSRIPDFPRPAFVDGTNTPRSPPGPRRTIASAFSQMEQYLTMNTNPSRGYRPLVSARRAANEVETPTSSTFEDIPTASNDTIRRLQRLQSLRSSERQHSSSSEGSMDAQASTTTADDQEMPAQSRNLLSFVESRAHITDLENQLDRLHARMLNGRHTVTSRELQRSESERSHHRLGTPRGSQVLTRPALREVPPIEGDRVWSSITTDSSGVSLEVQASRTPDQVSEPPEQTEQREQSTQTSDRPPGRIWSLANSVQDIETELAHLSEGAARRSAELASLSQQLEQQTRQYAATRSAVVSESSGEHNDILGRANEGLRQLRELRERREQREQQEQIRQVWGNVDDEDYVSPVSALFQRSWQAYNRRQQAEREGRRPSPTSVWFPEPGDDHRMPLDLVSAANEASSLLQNFREGLEGETITGEQQELIDRAVEGILRMRREVRARTRSNRDRRSRRSRGRAYGEPKGLDEDDSRPPPLEPEGMRLDCECKVCFGQVADTVLLPCSHLVLCGWCADQMGIHKSSEFSSRTVQCPICRANVFDRIKVFRG